MEVIRYPHPVLKQICRPLKKVDAELVQIIREMFTLMYDTNGVGLAANQVGLPYRFFVMNETGEAKHPEKELVFLNPEITKGSGKPVMGEEGCLSFPKLYIEVPRAPKVTISAYNLQGEAVKMTLTGFAARIVQHEYDHLDGVSFFQRALQNDFDALDALDALAQQFKEGQANGTIPSNEEIQKELERLIKLRA